jgi:nicotinate-nucleotide adenylyltransferase
MMRGIGLYCGTFNPIHNGHLLIAECARDQFSLEKVLFVTSAKPPHRHSGLLPSELRHQLVTVAVQDNSHFEASRLELDRSGPSYTIDTVASVRQMYGEDVEVNLIIGGDNLKKIGEWHKAQQLVEWCRFLVAPRLVYEETVLTRPQNHREAAVLERVLEDAPEMCDLPGAKVSIIEFPAVSISSSQVRERIAAGKSVLYMVPEAVNQILLQSRELLIEAAGDHP